MRNIELCQHKTQIGVVKKISNQSYDEAFLSASKETGAENIKYFNIEVRTAKELKKFKLKFGECLMPVQKETHATVQLTGLDSKDFTIRIASVVCDKGTFTEGEVPVSISILLVR